MGATKSLLEEQREQDARDREQFERNEEKKRRAHNEKVAEAQRDMELRKMQQQHESELHKQKHQDEAELQKMKNQTDAELREQELQATVAKHQADIDREKKDAEHRQAMKQFEDVRLKDVEEQKTRCQQFVFSQCKQVDRSESQCRPIEGFALQFEGLSKHLQDESLHTDAYTISKAQLEDVTEAKASATVQELYRNLPEETRATMAGVLMKDCFEKHDFSGKCKAMEMNVGGKMTYTFFETVGKPDGGVDANLVHCVAPEGNCDPQRMLAAVIDRGLIGVTGGENPQLVLDLGETPVPRES